MRPIAAGYTRFSWTPSASGGRTHRSPADVHPASRAAEAIIASVIARLVPDGDAVGAAVFEIGNQVLKNWNGIRVGEVRVTGEIS